MRGVAAQRIVRTIRKPRNKADEAIAPKPGWDGAFRAICFVARLANSACYWHRLASRSSSRKASVATTRGLFRGSLSLTGRRNEAKRHPIVAPALTRRRRAVVEHVSLVTAAAHAVILGPRHDEQRVGLGSKVLRDAGEKAGPSGTAVVFHFGAEQRKGTTGANENPRSFLVIKRTGEWALGRFLAQHKELRLGKSLLPLRFTLLQRCGAAGRVGVLGEQRSPIALDRGNGLGLRSVRGGRRDGPQACTGAQRGHSDQEPSSLHGAASLPMDNREAEENS